MAAVHTELVGAGRPVVAYLHGLFGRGRNWTGIAAALDAEGFPGVLVDLPNHGRSAWTPGVDYLDLADRLAAEFDERLGSAARLLLVGHSMGGKVAMLLALRHPELVAGLAVVDIAPSRSAGVDSFAELFAALHSLDLATLRSRGEADAQLTPLVPDPAVRGFLLQNLRRRPRWHWQPNLALLEANLDVIGDWPDPGAGPYRGPVRWLTGAHSPYVGASDEAPMRALFPAVRRVVVPDSGHWVQADQPEAVVAELVDLARESGLRPRPPT
ncbi:MAG TPA: alpha/beta fold hydrolase [Propionicimonas sp.]|jgi:pimeloyl-ACP methyl ester carboxylesterase|nr:alpha/beta fold hydrolase [Propionicimonas sp.]